MLFRSGYTLAVRSGVPSPGSQRFGATLTRTLELEHILDCAVTRPVQYSVHHSKRNLPRECQYWSPIAPQFDPDLQLQTPPPSDPGAFSTRWKPLRSRTPLKSSPPEPRMTRHEERKRRPSNGTGYSDNFPPNLSKEVNWNNRMWGSSQRI